MKSYKIGILSAHEGASYWPHLIYLIQTYEDLDFVSLHLFSDKEYRSAKSIVSRLYLRFQVFVIYPLYCLFQMLFQQKYDAFIVVTSPFFLPSICALLSKKPIISLQNDIYPEALIQANIVKRDSIYEVMLRRVSGYGVTKAQAVVYLCKGHRMIAERCFGVNTSTYVIPVGANGAPFIDYKPEVNCLPVCFLYCGTLGSMHDSETILNYLRYKEVLANCRLEFFTSGSGKANFEKNIRQNFSNLLLNGTIGLSDSLNEADWVSKMRSASVGMVFQGNGSENVIFPSKVYSILVAGQAVLAIASLSSELGQMIVEHDCGWVVEPGDIEGLSRVFYESLVPETLLRKRRNAFVLGHAVFDVTKLSVDWHKLILRACADGVTDKDPR